MAELRSPVVVLGDRLDLDGAACAFDPGVDVWMAEVAAVDPCPFTTLSWDFLMRHEAAPARNPRMALQVKDVTRLTDVQRQTVNERAAANRRGEVGADAGALAHA